MSKDTAAVLELPRDQYEDDASLREARALYFQRNGFGPDGGYAKKAEVVKIGPLPFVVPNPAARVAALRYHDLHHVLTGYRTDWRGEFEIACYELASGCGRLWFAWLINWAGAGGALLLPRRGVRAWARGRISGGLYHQPYHDALLDRTVGDVRGALRLNENVEPSQRDWMAFLFAAVTGAVVGIAVHVLPLIALVAFIRWLVT